MKIKIFNVKLKYRAVLISMTKEVVNLIGSDVVVIEEDNGYLRLRQPTMFDKRTINIFKSPDRNICIASYSSDNAKNFIGEWKIEQEGDYFYLDK